MAQTGQLENFEVHVRLVEAKDLRRVTAVTKQDPYAILRTSTDNVRTPVCKDGDAKPVWDFKCLLHGTVADTLIVAINHEASVGQDVPIATARVSLAQFVNGQVHDNWFPLKSDGADAGQVHLRVQLMRAGGVPIASAPAAAPVPQPHPQPMPVPVAAPVPMPAPAPAPYFQQLPGQTQVVPGYSAPVAPPGGMGYPAPMPVPGYGAPGPYPGMPMPAPGYPAPGMPMPAPGYPAPYPGAPAPAPYGMPAPGYPGMPPPGYPAPFPGTAPGPYGANPPPGYPGSYPY